MTLNRKIIVTIFVILTSLSFGYLLKILCITDVQYKILMSAIFTVYLLLAVFSRSKWQVVLALLSVLIFIYEWNAIHTVPFVIHLSEAGIKIISPVIILLLLKQRKLPETFVKTSICLTFIAHGLLALNVIPTPETFYSMTEKILHFTEAQSKLFLQAAGILDILACVIIILNNKGKWYKYALYYCIVWGSITALARTAYVYDTGLNTILFSGITETLVRLPNSFIPLLLLISKKKYHPDFL